jgi:hypothetical protein
MVKATMCDREELIVGYVYDELSREDRAALEAHMAGCAACRTDLAELRATRGYLASWKPPEPDLGFRVIGGAAAPAPALPRPNRFAPAFAYAAAAVLVLAAAAAIANVEISYGPGGATVRTGWSARPAPADQLAAAPAPAAGSETAAVPAADFSALDRRLREIEAALGAAATGPASVQLAAATRMSDAEILRRVRQIVSEAESRQETAVAQRMLDIVRDFDVQRRADIALIQQGLGQYQGLTNAEIAQNRDMLNQLVRAATTRQEK